MVSSRSTSTGRQVSCGPGIYLAPEPGEDAPRQIVVDGRRFTRFMDSIYLDRPCEKLDLKKIQVLNRVRRPLLERGPIGAVNARLHAAFARGVAAVRPGQVLEWGCGYHPLRDLVTTSGYAGVDIDPSVIDHNRERYPTTSWYQADRDLADIADESQDVIVSPFVFHFRISRVHMSTMWRALKPSGILLANVYRRSPRSRRELVSRFRRSGFQVHRKKDVTDLCTGHEFWCLTRDGHPDAGVPAGVLSEVAAGIADTGRTATPA